jgi:hypothetical protein
MKCVDLEGDAAQGWDNLTQSRLAERLNFTREEQLAIQLAEAQRSGHGAIAAPSNGQLDALTGQHDDRVEPIMHALQRWSDGPSRRVIRCEQNRP